MKILDRVDGVRGSRWREQTYTLHVHFMYRGYKDKYKGMMCLGSCK